MKSRVKRSFFQWIRWWFPRHLFTWGRSDRYQDLRTKMFSKSLDALERELDGELSSLPPGPERQEVNDQLLYLRTLRVIKGV